jgi:tRNA-Thr(GGU) m(6)t(6)A37 methyltransferase TsaA
MEFTPLGRVHTCFKEKFGIPRQPNLVKQAPGKLVFFPKFARQEAVRKLDSFSHIWLLFCFHHAVNKDGDQTWLPMVRPPRLGGNQKVGVFASRSPFRPNPIGMSCVCLESVEITDKGPILHLSGVDLLDKTPVLDIKPYLPYADVMADARDGFAPAPPRTELEVVFTDQAKKQMARRRDIPDLKKLITEILENDPRPAYAAGENTDRVYGTRLFDFNLRFRFHGKQVDVLDLQKDFQ